MSEKFASCPRTRPENRTHVANIAHEQRRRSDQAEDCAGSDEKTCTDGAAECPEVDVNEIIWRRDLSKALEYA
jgi:hypothetical protein